MHRSIQCPNCQTTINVEEIVSQQIRKEIEDNLQQRQLALATAEQKLKTAEQELEEKKKQENQLFRARLEKEKNEIRKEEQAKINEEQQKKENELVALRFEKQKQDAILQQQAEKLKQQELLEQERVKTALAQKETELLQRNQQQIAEAIKQQQIHFDMHKKTFEESLRQREKEQEERFAIKEKEYQKKLADQEKLTEEMLRKQKQGSMQLQGEVQELLIEELLRAQFPDDKIEEVKKGARGADCLQHIMHRGKHYGIICYESKRTQHFSTNYIPKLKEDIRLAEANIGVLVTESLPKEMEHSGEKDGIWICTRTDLPILAKVLRHSIIEQKTQIIAQENKGNKMHALYDFLTSPQFKTYVEEILRVFSDLEEELKKEQKTFQTLWTRRENALRRAQNNLIHMYGTLQGISGGAVRDIKELSLDTLANSLPLLQTGQKEIESENNNLPETPSK